MERKEQYFKGSGGVPWQVSLVPPHICPRDAVLRRWKQDPRTHRRQRWLIIYQALVDPREAAQIARPCGVSTATVHQLISAYNRRGVDAVETPGKGGRRNQYLTLEQEQE